MTDRTEMTVEVECYGHRRYTAIVRDDDWSMQADGNSTANAIVSLAAKLKRSRPKLKALTYEGMAFRLG